MIPAQAWSRDVAATGYSDGAPIGGFGAGNVTWRSNGGFYLTRLNIGDGNDNSANAVWNNNANCGFYYYTRPSAGGTIVTRKLDSTLGTGQATYYALFPKAWVDYSGSSFPVKARATQFSPLIPNDYQRVSYPLGVYEWELSNPTGVSQDVAILLTWQNTFSGTAATLQSTGATGLVLGRGAGSATLENQGEFALAALTQTGVTVTRMSAATQAAIVADFNADGALPDTVGAHAIGGLSIKATLAAGATVRVPMALTWDIPITQVGTGNRWYRRYTRYFTRTGLNSWAMAQDALANHASWESQLDAWQNGILGNAAYPNWLKSMLFNELYIYFAGGTYWEAGAASGQTDDPNEDMFSHLESYIYPFYGTSDVRFYGSWALLMNWPDIDKQALRQFSDSVVLNPAAIGRPAALGTTAHDFGDNNDLFTRWNAYVYRDSTNWKDLNSKLVLMIYRDYLATGSTDTALLNYTWNAVVTAMAKVKSQDTDADGLPNSAGIDQTYDDMALNGDTAYCGSLFLAACQAAKQIALARGQAAQAATWQSWYDLAQPNFESQLWNATGGYYNIATGSTPAEPADRIMSDQLCGHWYSKALGLGGIVPDARATSAFQKIHDNNFMRFDTGTHGIVNVMTAAGNIDTSHPQTQEVWVGTSWGAAAGMVYQGLLTQASAVGQSLYNTIWNTGQFWFRTPEAWRTGLTGTRAYYYMRATAVWAVKQAYDNQNPCAPAACTPTRTPTTGPSATRTPTPTVTATLTPLPCGVNTVRARMRAAGTAFTDGASNVWAAEQAYAVGGWGYVNGTQAGTSANPIANTTDDGLYQAERYGSPLEYRFTVPNGLYLVRVKVAETYFSGAGQRIFDLALEGSTVASGIDIFARVGANAALDLTFTVAVSDGILNLLATGSVDNARIGAIEATQLFGGACASATPTATRSPLISATPSASPSATPSRSSTPSATPSPTGTLTATPTRSPTLTASATMTRSPSPSASPTASSTGTTGLGSHTSTPSPSPTGSRTPSPTVTPTPSASPTRTASGTHSLTVSPTFTRTPTVTQTLTVSPTGSHTPTASPSFTPVPTNSSATPTPTLSPTWSSSPTMTLSGTSTLTASPSSTPSVTATLSSSPTLTATQSSSPTASPTVSVTLSVSPTLSPTVTVTFLDTYTHSPTSSQTLTPTPSMTRTPTVTATLTASATGTSTVTATASPVSTALLTATPTLSGTRTATPTPSATGTPSLTLTATRTATPSATLTATPTQTALLPTLTLSPTPSPAPATGVPHVIAVISVPNPQSLSSGSLKLKVLLDKPASALRLRIYTKALNVVLAQDISGNFAGSWNALNLPLRLPSAGLYYVQVSALDQGSSTEAVLAKIMVLP